MRGFRISKKGYLRQPFITYPMFSHWAKTVMLDNLSWPILTFFLIKSWSHCNNKIKANKNAFVNGVVEWECYSISGPF